jgi:hypothetical protein
VEGNPLLAVLAVDVPNLLHWVVGVDLARVNLSRIVILRLEVGPLTLAI